MMTEAELEAIEARLEATTPGEWRWRGGTSVLVEYLSNEDLEVVYFDFLNANGQWLAHAHNRDTPDLIAEVRRAWDEAEAMEEYIQSLEEDLGELERTDSA